MQVTIDENSCKGCMLCTTFCPKKIIKKSDRLNKHGYFVPEVKSQQNCIGCRNCELYCSEFAVSVEE